MFAGRIGVARSDITPPAGIYCRNWGAATHDVAEGIHRPLTLTALAILSTDAKDDPLVLIDAEYIVFMAKSVEGKHWPISNECGSRLSRLR